MDGVGELEARVAQEPAQIPFGDPMARELARAQQEHRDLEHVAGLQPGVLAHVLLLQAEAELGQDPLEDGVHLPAEPAVGLAEEDEGRRRAQEAIRPSVAGRRKRVARPAAAITRTIASWTARAVRSGWIPIHGISGKGTGRGLR